MARDRRPQTSGERSEEERERARAERERRRLAKGDAAQPVPPVEGPPVPPLPPPLAESSVGLENTPNGLMTEDPPALEPEPKQSETLDPEQPETLEPEQRKTLEPEQPETLEPEQRKTLEPEPPETLEPEQREAPEPEQPGTLEPEQHEAPEPEWREAAEQASPRYPLPLLSSTSARTGRRRKQRGSLPKQHRPHVHRPHLHGAHGSSIRTGAARMGAVLALLVVLAAIAAGVVLLTRHSQRPKPPPVPAIVKVVIPEGYTRLQIAALAHADGLRGSYLTASKKSTELSPAHYGAPAGTPSLEGFLFPATYEMYAGAQVSQLVSEQLAAFGENFGGGEVHRAKVLGVTPYELLIVASIIEREAAIPHDRPLVAAVIYNRLHLNMTLGVDSTLRYALHDFTHPLTETELNSDSPYNTRIHKGLPPTPISNPGAAAIAAAARPAKVSYLYYVAGADGCGEQVFSTSYSQFEKNAAAYHEALSKNGGNVPHCKKG